MTKMEDNQNERRPKVKDNRNGRRLKWKMTEIEDEQMGDDQN